MRTLEIILRDIYGNKRITWASLKTAYRYAQKRKKVMPLICISGDQAAQKTNAG